MPTNNRTTRQPALVMRACALCGDVRAILPTSREHRKAHQNKQIAFVCEDCAALVRLEVEVAADPVEPSEVLA